MQQPSIALIGHVCIDRNTSEHVQYEAWGSSVLYMAKYWQKQGQQPHILASYGEDFLPFKHDFRLVPATPNAGVTLRFENISKAGQRSQRCVHAKEALPPEFTPESMELLKTADIVVFAPLLANYPLAYVKQALAAANPQALKVCAPQGYFRTILPDGSVHRREAPIVSELIGLFDVTVYSQADCTAPLVFAKQATTGTDSAVIVTQGEEGATLITKGHLEHISTTPVAEDDIIDSVGCGDTFSAAVADGLFHTKDLHKAVLHGHQAARDKLFSAPE